MSSLTPGAGYFVKTFFDKDKPLFGTQSPCHSITDTNLWPIISPSDYWGCVGLEQPQGMDRGAGGVQLDTVWGVMGMEIGKKKLIFLKIKDSTEPSQLGVHLEMGLDHPKASPPCVHPAQGAVDDPTPPSNSLSSTILAFPALLMG